MDVGDVTAAVAGISAADSDLGWRIYDHVRRTQPEQAIELPTGRGVSAAYLAAALDANDFGRLTTIDHASTAHDPAPERLLSGAGLGDRVDVVRVHSSYNWFLKELLQEASDDDGHCEPPYDFVHLAGPHEFSTDGLAVVLIEKLLRADGWLLLSRLESVRPDDVRTDEHDRLSERERAEPHGLALFELIVAQEPSFTHLLRDEAGDGWAQKRSAPLRPHTVDTSRPLGASVAAELRRRRWPLRRSGGGR